MQDRPITSLTGNAARGNYCFCFVFIFLLGFYNDIYNEDDIKVKLPVALQLQSNS